MNEQSGILRAIAENPDEITHRLVYADWLDDHGQGRLAEFIRTQCAQEQFLLDPTCETSYLRSIEVMSLKPDLHPGLLASFRSVYGDLNDTDQAMDAVLSQWFSFWIRRGLIEDVEVYGGKAIAVFLRHAPAILSQIPLLHLRISRAATRAADRSLAVSDVVPIDDIPLQSIGALLKYPEISRLRTLNLVNLELGNSLGTLLLRCRNRFQPQRLMLDGNNLDPSVAEKLHDRFGEALTLTPYQDKIPF